MIGYQISLDFELSSESYIQGENGSEILYLNFKINS